LGFNGPPVKKKNPRQCEKVPVPDCWRLKKVNFPDYSGIASHIGAEIIKKIGWYDILTVDSSFCGIH
jgi:hypothetical protein